MKVLISAFAIIGLITIVYLVVGFVLDATSFDQTKGGYESPYEGWTGEPVDWESMDRTKAGLVKRGYVIDVHVNGTTGMISFGILGQRIEWQQFSGRALKVHKPREALMKMGFQPEF